MAASVRGMGPERAAKFVKPKSARGDMHAARAASLANSVTGALAAAALGVSAIGVGLAQARGTATKHWREAGGSAAEQQEAGRVGGVRVVGSARVGRLRKKATVSLDWTSFAADGQEVVALSMTIAPRIGRRRWLLADGAGKSES